MDIIQFLKEDACSVSLSSRHKKECVRELSQILCRVLDDIPVEKLNTAFLEREEQGSTAFENGIAIPHARIKELDTFYIGIALSKRGVDFQSVDGKRTHIFFSLIGPREQSDEFLRLLAQISLVAKNPGARRDLMRAKSPLSLKEVFLEHIPGGLPSHRPEGKKKLLTIVLYETQYLDDISEIFLENGVRGASVVDSVGLRGVLTHVPLFADFMNFLGDTSEESKTITTVVAESQLERIVNSVEQLVGDLDSHSGVMIYTTDVDFIKGSLEVF